MEKIRTNLQNQVLQNNNLKNNDTTCNKFRRFEKIQDSVSFSGRNIVAQKTGVSELLKQFLQYFPNIKYPASIQRVVDSADALLMHISSNAVPARKFVREVASKSQILMLGERHDNLSAKKFATSMLKPLKKQGYFDIALELNTNFQKHIDNFMAGKISEEELLKLTIVKTPFGIDAKPLEEGCSINLIKECKKLGLNVHCIDSRGDENFFSKMLELQSNLDIKGMMSYTYSQDENIFNNLNNRIFQKRPDAKVLIYIGQAHIDKMPTKENPQTRLRQFIDKSGKTVNSLYICTPENINNFVDTKNVKPYIGFSTTDKSISNLPYSVQSSYTEIKPSEYYGKHLDGMVVVE